MEAVRIFTGHTAVVEVSQYYKGKVYICLPSVTDLARVLMGPSIQTLETNITN